MTMTESDPNTMTLTPDAELIVAEDEAHAPCAAALNQLLTGINNLTEPGVLWLNPETATLLRSTLDRAHAIASFVAGELDAMEYELPWD